jgi:hypothetical protein
MRRSVLRRAWDPVLLMDDGMHRVRCRAGMYPSTTPAREVHEFLSQASELQLDEPDPVSGS